ncbi:MAG TPA: hypothetical protein VEW07_05185 [Solirubrobacterales bacterium]|nr:hypothetical protein [Solirubrobacterales bacterium]
MIRGQSGGRIHRERSEQSPALGNPAQTLLEHRHRELAGDQVADDQGQQGSIGRDVGAQEDAGRLGTEPLLQRSSLAPAVGGERRGRRG